MDKIKWRRPGTKLVREDVTKVECLLGIRFPDDYINCALMYHGASVIPYRVYVNNHERVFANLLSFSDESSDNIIRVYYNYKERLKSGVIPFACDPAGNLFCFDYRKDKEKPSIIFCHHELCVIASDYNSDDLKRINLEDVQEKAIEFVCANFTELLNILY